jgi:N-acyl-D-aspartate/D-glutamate deacylase
MTDSSFDLLIRGGTVYDGTGAPAVRADIAVRDGKIARIGNVDGSAARTIDATGKAVAPGFIDVHAHDDAAVLDGPMDFKLMQGVTTDIVGNCGAGSSLTGPFASLACPWIAANRRATRCPACATTSPKGWTPERSAFRPA